MLANTQALALASYGHCVPYVILLRVALLLSTNLFIHMSTTMPGSYNEEAHINPSDREEEYDVISADLISSYHFDSGAVTDRVQKASKLMLLAPPGELEEVFQNIRIIINNDDELKDGIGSTFDVYNYENFTSVTLPGCDYDILLTSHNRLKEHVYYDPNTGKKFIFNPFDNDVQMLDSAIDPSPHNAMREAYQHALNAYVGKHYPTGTGMVTASTLEDNTSSVCFVFCISSSKSNTNSYWNGQWISEWTLRWTEHRPSAGEHLEINDLPQCAKNATMQGAFSIKVHYFEDGNVQLFSNTSVLYPLEDDVGIDAILKIIEAEEDKFQLDLNDSYGTLSENTFRTLRKALPITKAKLDWDKIFAYKLGAAFAGNSTVPTFPLKKRKDSLVQ